MSGENVEIVRALSDDFARGEYERALGVFDEEIEFVSPQDVTGGSRVWHGYEGVRRGMASFLATWEDYQYEVRDLTDCGDAVLVEAWQRGRGRGSGVEVSESIYTVWTVRGGKVIRYGIFRDREEARRAAGLEG
jgi:ketosteroid isomerase-like protein